MAKEFSRSRRVADLVQRELAVLIQRYIQDDNSGLVTVSTVDISPDLKNAKVYFTCLANKLPVEVVSEKLNECAGQFRHELSKSLVMRNIPKLHFVFDQNLDRANRLTALIESLHADKNPDQD